MKTFKSFNFFKFFRISIFRSIATSLKFNWFMAPATNSQTRVGGWSSPTAVTCLKFLHWNLIAHRWTGNLRTKDSNPIDFYKPLREARQKAKLPRKKGRLDFSNFEVPKDPYQSREAHESSEPAHARKLQLKKKFLFNLKSNYSSLSLRFSKTRFALHFNEKLYLPRTLTRTPPLIFTLFVTKY